MNKIIISFSILFFLFTSSFRAQWVQTVCTGAWTVNSLACKDSIIYAGTGYYGNPTGVYITTNNGQNWSQTSLNNRPITSLALINQYIFAGTNESGVYLSTNNGQNWTQTSLNRIVLALAAGGNTVYEGNFIQGYYESVMYSTNFGQNWLATSLMYDTIFSLAVCGNYIYAGAYDRGIFISSNNGQNWTQAPGLGTVYTLVMDSINIFAGTYNGVYLSTNHGQNWTLPSSNITYVISLAISHDSGRTDIFVGTYYSGVYKSTNNGLNWVQFSEGMGNQGIYSLLTTSNYIFAGSYNGIVYRRPIHEIVGINKISNDIPERFSLSQNYPNPFNPVTKIKFNVSSKVKSETSNVKITVYNILGNEITTLVNEHLQPGSYQVEWNGTNFSSGVYFYKLVSGEFTETKKMILLK